jgi:hypothetical protein
MLASAAVAHIERPGSTLIKKLFAVAAATGLFISLAGSTPAYNNDNEKQNWQPGQKVERTMVVDPQAIVTLCVASGALTVTGWDKPEVRVRSLDAAQIEFRRIDKPKDPNTPANRIDVMVLDRTSRLNTRVNTRRDCQAIAEVEMQVPAGATVQVQTRDGDITITGVAAAYAGSQNGDIMIERATRLVEAGSVGGSISLKNSSGRVNLSSAGGGVEVVNVRAADPDDTFEVGTVSGDIQLNGISSPKVMAKTVNGTLIMSGALVKAGSYTFTNMTGDVVLLLPSDASFRLNAKVSEVRHIVSDFALKFISEPTPAPPTPKAYPVPQPQPAPPAAGPGKVAPATGPTASAKTPAPKDKPATKDAKDKEKPVAKAGPVLAPIIVDRATVVAPYVRRIDAICGTGDAMISVASFGGTVRLKKLVPTRF